MMKLLTTIDRISKISTLKDQVYYSTFEGFLFCNENIIVSKIEPSSFWLYDDYIYFHTIDGLYGYFSFSTGSLQLSEINIDLDNRIENNAVCSYDFEFHNNPPNWKTGIFNLTSFRLEREIIALSGKPIACWIGDSIFSYYESVDCIKTVDISKNTVLSSFVIPQKKHFKKIGIYSNSYWLYSRPRDFIDINKITGKISHYEFFVNEDTILDCSFNFPHLVENKLHFFEKNALVEVDLDLKRFIKNWKGSQYFVTKSTFLGEYIYFIGRYPNSLYSTIVGIFDRNKNDIVWTDTIDLPPYETLNKGPEVAGNKLYVGDSTGKLYIYERIE